MALALKARQVVAAAEAAWRAEHNVFGHLRPLPARFWNGRMRVRCPADALM
jgi:deoxyribodipyrimidine photolyase-like uncharacterized protein